MAEPSRTGDDAEFGDSSGAWFGVVDITPDEPLVLAGFSGRHRVSDGVHSRLEANHVFVRTSDRRHLVVAVDLLYGGVLGGRLATELQGLVAADEITICASHTHFAPATEPAIAALGAVDTAYVDRTVTAIAASVRRSLSSVPATSSTHTSAPTRATTGRRRRAWVIDRSDGAPLVSRRLWRRPSRAPAAAHDAHLVRFHADPRPDGAGGPAAATRPACVGVLWSLACHPSELPATHQISAEYPGVVRDRLRRDLGRPDLPVVFVQGFAGDMRPAITSWWRGHSRASRLENLLNLGPGFRSSDLPTWTAWAGRLADQVSALQTTGRSSRLTLDVRAEVIPTDALYPGSPAGLESTVRSIRLGDELTLLVLSGEPTSDLLAPALAAAGGRSTLVPGGYGDRTVGYLPGPTVLIEGGYEAGDFLERFGVDWTVAPAAATTTIAAMSRVLGGPSDGGG